ncbi:CynX/NimT family MFS transporter [Actinomadura bangladeshensis]|uniref:MFS transporter n=1 Tax=Actinomadura bangladeshensis TaxID=453573 RepID=A0A6L9QRR4_9ACTN|nr:MFS transporter [Actinomadura bangladeshensis]NEA27582.1 MFS transporter [Actinomadura bangladeshensis]
MSTSATTPVSRATAVWSLVGLVLLTVNLRAAITGIAPVLGELRDAFGLSGAEVGVLTTLPVLCLGVFAGAAPLVARRVGTETAIAGSLVMITAGIVLRVVESPLSLFVGTVLAGAGIAMGNVLMPAVIKRVFPSRVGSLTGLAMMLMATSGAVAAGLAVPLDEAGGWRLALAVWAVPSLVAALVWGPLALRGRRAPTAPVTAPRGEGSLLRSRVAWYVAVFMGLTSLMFYVLMSWLPEIMQDAGFAPGAAGMMVSAMLIVGIPLGFVVPVFAARLPDQRPLIVAVAVTMVVGIGGLLLAPSAGWVWAIVLGIGTGSAFPLAYTLLSLRAPSPSVAAALSGMAQTGGYLLAGVGPLAVGVLHDATGGWTVPLGLLLALVVPEVVFGLLAARPGFVRPARPRTRPAERARALASARTR